MIINHNISTLAFATGKHVIVASDPYGYLNYNPLPDYSTNLCSKAYDNDRELAAMVNMEAWNMYGVKIVYYKATYNTNYDRIWGEDGDRHVTEFWNVMSYFQLPRENKVWGKFGIEGVNDFSMFISKEHFRFKTDDYIPKIGDLVLALSDNKFYEITEVKEEAPMFMLSKQYAWELICRKMKIEQDISVSPALSATPIAQMYNTKDIFNINNNIDIDKEPILYEPIKGEKPVNDPFGKW
jgi:hypothetical protein